MIDSATGMKPGERYSIESQERTHHFPGFFLDGKYYLGPELMTAVGWLEGQKFLYDELDALGDPVFPERVAGVIEDLTLTLNDGARLKLKEVRFHAPLEQPDPKSTRKIEGGWRDAKKNRPLLIAGLTALAFGGIAFALARQKREKRGLRR
ncbi:Oxidoreductase [Pseudomonas sp. R4-39-08]|nr:short chain dehydrogenase [Pseudomonas sp. R4-39-08]AZF36476.1 Oxidoreductase [Pseudomonas sp. R4-39-08]